MDALQQFNPLNYSLVDLVLLGEPGTVEEKTTEYITVCVNSVWYLIPRYCLQDLLWGMPDEFYPCNKYEWLDHPLYFTTVEMVKTVVADKPDTFKAFIYDATKVHKTADIFSPE